MIEAGCSGYIEKPIDPVIIMNQIREIIGLNLFSFHKFIDFVMVADEKKRNAICEVKENTVFNPGMDFPVVPMPIFETQARGQVSFAIQVFQE